MCGTVLQQPYGANIWNEEIETVSIEFFKEVWLHVEEKDMVLPGKEKLKTEI